MADKPELTEPCHLGAVGEACVYGHVAAAFPRGIGGGKNYRLCPVHGGRDASISINPGHTYRVVWNEKYAYCELSDLDIRALLLQAGVDDSCLGTYGLPKRTVVPGLRVQRAGAATIADAKRWQAMLKLPADLAGKLLIMCRQALAEGDGDLPGDPYRLLPRTKVEFTALGRRAGLQRNYPNKLWDAWQKMLSDAA